MGRGVRWCAAATLAKAQEEYAQEKWRKQQEFRHYSFEQLAAACANFAEEQLVGEGGYGAVYKGLLDHFPVAVKVLKNAHSDQAMKEFKKEVGLANPEPPSPCPQPLCEHVTRSS